MGFIRTIGQVLPFPKGPHTDEEKTCLIYSVPCSNSEYLHVTRTNQVFESRLSEHKKAIMYQTPEQSAQCKHVMLLDHSIDWNNSRTFESCDQLFSISKACFTNSYLSVILVNRSDIDSLLLVLSIFNVLYLSFFSYSHDIDVVLNFLIYSSRVTRDNLMKVCIWV